MFINRRRTLQVGGVAMTAPFAMPAAPVARRIIEPEFAGTLGETQTRGVPRPPAPLLHFPPEVPPAHPYAKLVQNATGISTTSRLIIPQSAARRNFLAVRNASPGTEVIYVSFNVEATPLSWLVLTPNQIALFDTVVPQDSVYVIADAATAVVAYAFSTLPTYIFHDEATKIAEMRRKQDFLGQHNIQRPRIVARRRADSAE